MSNTKKYNIAIFQNLPEGGARRTYNELTEKLKKDNDIQIFTVRNRVRGNFFSYLLDLFFFLKREHKLLAKLIDKKKFDFVLVHHDFLTKSPYLLRFLKTTSFYLCHEEPREFYDDRSYFITTLKSMIVNVIRYPLKYIDITNVSKASFVITNSVYSKQKLEKIYKREFFIVNLGVDCINFPVSQIKKESFFLTIGATSIFKGLDFIIRSIGILPRRYKFPLVIVGSVGRDHSKIINLAIKYGVKIDHKISVTEKDLIKLYQKTKLLLAAAINEPFGLSLIEANSCGTRVIAVNEGGYKDILTQQKQGLLVNRNKKIYSEAIVKSLQIKNDRQFLHKLVEVNWSWEKTILQLSKIFRKNTTLPKLGLSSRKGSPISPPSVPSRG